MREIRFRAWNDVTKKMESWEAVRPQFSICTVTKYMKLMQYTGLKDKNGKEIYEGDILIDDEYPEDGIGYAEVIWKEYKWSTKGWGVEGSEFESYEVIGNIYEPPELIK